MKKLLLLGFGSLLLIQQDVVAQNPRCGVQQVMELFLAKDPKNAAIIENRPSVLAQQTSAFEEFLDGTRNKTTQVVTVPVVFHIILTTAQITQLGGVAGIQQRVTTQLEVLNQDFSKSNNDTNLIPAPFKPLAANSQIQFGLAHRKPNGSGTDGYEIITTTKSSYDINAASTEAKSTSSGGADPWDPTRYLNIWVLNISGGILGFTNPPSIFPTMDWGIALNYGAFGKRTGGSQYFIPNIDKGRTLTHEAGHYFELDHIWGDDNGKCPGDIGGMDDGIADTPPQASEHFGNPTYPFVSCNNGPNGDMFMNYMDYVNDAAMYLFTQGQVTRMRSQTNSGAPSYTLTIHPELLQWPTSVTGIDNSGRFHLYPNPSQGKFRVSFTEAKNLEKIQIMNLMGQVIYSVPNPEVLNKVLEINLDGVPKGLYFVHCFFGQGSVTKKITIE